MAKWLVGLCVLLMGIVGCSSSTGTVSDPAPAQQPIRVEVWHDLVCPWCRIGLHNLEKALASWDGPPVEVVHRAYLLSPSTPPEGVDMREHMRSKLGGEDQLAASHARVAQAGAQAGLTFDFDAQKVMPQTAPTHAVIAWAPAAKRGALIRAIHEAHFLQGRNIGDGETLGAIAASVGLDAAAARAAAADPQRLAAVRAEAQGAGPAGVRGVPHIVIGEQALRGAQPPAVVLQALTEASAAR